MRGAIQRLSHAQAAVRPQNSSGRRERLMSISTNQAYRGSMGVRYLSEAKAQDLLDVADVENELLIGAPCQPFSIVKTQRVQRTSERGSGSLCPALYAELNPEAFSRNVPNSASDNGDILKRVEQRLRRLDGVRYGGVEPDLVCHKCGSASSWLASTENPKLNFQPRYGAGITPLRNGARCNRRSARRW